MRPDTIAIHFAQEPDPTTGSLNTPIAQTSTFVQDAPGVNKGYDYSRTNNPTRETLERVLAKLEGVEHGAVFASGLAAENAIFQAFCRDGDVIATTPDVYGGTHRLLNDVLRVKHVRDLDDDGAKIVWIESPTNPRLQTFDIEAICERAHARGQLVVVDNTFATPVHQRPFELGADLVVHSVTKYLSGHSDVIQGAVVARDPELHARIKHVQNATGAVPSAFDCWLTLRGLKTLSLRMARHSESATTIAQYLREQPDVAEVFYPGFGGVVSFEYRGDARRFVSSTRYFKLAESLGGVKSLICHPASMTHAAVPDDLGPGASLIRLSVGLEDVQDLVEDLACASTLVGYEKGPEEASHS